MTINASGWLVFGLLFVIGTVLVGLLCVLILPVFLVVAVTQKKAETYKLNRENTIVAQYDPPKNLSPAEAGYLYDMNCGKNEIKATLFDLERRRVIRFTDEKSIQIIDNNAFLTLKDFEKIAINEFSSINDTGSLKIAQTKSSSINEFNRSVKEAVLAKGFTVKSKFLEISKRAISFAIIIGLWPLIVCLINGVNFNNTSYRPWEFGAFTSGIALTLTATFFLFPFYIAAGFIMMKLWIKIAGEYWLGSKSVRAFWPELEGYRLFIKEADLESIQYDAGQNTNLPIDIVIPYAIAFNLDTKWKLYINSKF